MGSLWVLPPTVQTHAISGVRLSGDFKLTIGVNVCGLVVCFSVSVLRQIGNLSSVYLASCPLVAGIGSKKHCDEDMWKRMNECIYYY